MPNSPPSRTVKCPSCGAIEGTNCKNDAGEELKRRVHWQRVAEYWHQAKKRAERLEPIPVPPPKRGEP